MEYAPDARQLRDVTDAQVYTTQYRSSQLSLWQFDDDEWLRILRLPGHSRKKQSRPPMVQAQLFTL